MSDKYQFLYDTLMTKVKNSDVTIFNDLRNDSFPNLDNDGYDVMYQLYETFMKKNNMSSDSYIINIEDVDEESFDVTLDFENMLPELKGLLYLFANMHYSSMLGN